MNAALAAAADAIVAGARAARECFVADAPFVIALDGPSGSGKTTLARRVAAALDAAVIPGDDFCAAHISDAEWDAHAAEMRAALAIDWERLRDDALAPLRAGRQARWHGVDFESGVRADGTNGLRPEPCVLDPRLVVVVDGAYSARPELADLVDFAVFVDVPIEARHARLDQREDAEFLRSWHARWDAAELHYFGTVRPQASFDLVVSN